MRFAAGGPTAQWWWPQLPHWSLEQPAQALPPTEWVEPSLLLLKEAEGEMARLVSSALHHRRQPAVSPVIMIEVPINSAE